MPTPLLPSLKENKVSIKKRGEWVAESQNTLYDLVDDLDVRMSKETDITSIPDIWAHPKMYEDILKDKRNYFYDEYISKWRGVIAILALRCARGLKDIKLSKVIIPDASNFKGNEPRFLKVVAKLIPESFKTGQKNEELLMQIITIKEKPLAFIWPSLLVCPAIGLNDIILDNISWWNDGKVLDPIKYLSDTEKYLLNIWIDRVKEPVNDKRLMTLLSDFQEDLHIGEEGPIPIEGVPLGITGPCRLVDYAPMPRLSASCIEDSQVRLVDQKKGMGDTDRETLLVITTDMDKQWDVPANKIVVAGNATFDSVANACFGGQVIGSNRTMVNGNDISAFNARLCSVNDFLTEKIAICYTEKNYFPNSENNIVIRFNNCNAMVVLPIKKQVLAYLDGDWLAKNISVEVKQRSTGDTTCDLEVKLNVPLSGRNNEQKLLTLTKLYSSAAGEIIGYDELPTVQVWPNFITKEPKNWQSYYSFFNAISEWKECMFYAEPYWEELNPIKMSNTSYTEIIQGKTFPEAYTCYAVEEKVGGSEEKEEIGLIILKRPEIIKTGSSNKNCTIGIDFGTTNTIAYYAINNNNPEIMRFNNRLYSVVDYDKSLDHEIRRNFFSDVEQPICDSAFIRSVFHTYDTIGNGDNDTPLSRGNIYYLKQCDNISKDECAIGDSLHDDMKWSEEGTEDKKGFLLQFCMQCMAEAIVKGATSIKWMYSYPQAFTDQQISNTELLWNNNILKAVGDISKLNTNSVKDKTESVSMAEFFKGHMDAKLTRGIVCLDIGGGSTDIAIWQKDQSVGGADSPHDLRYQCSIKFAGRKILNEYLFKKKEESREILPLLTSGDEEFDRQLDVVNSAGKSTFNMEIEAWLKFYENKIFKSLTSKSMNPKVAIILRDIAFALSGIFYYTGNIVTYLRNNNQYDEHVNLPNCYVGGNGSKLLNWPSKGEFRTGDSFQQVLINCLIKGMLNSNPVDEFDPNAVRNSMPKVHKTELPKQEVAYGLVSDSYISEGEEKNKAKQSTEDALNDLLFGDGEPDNSAENEEEAAKDENEKIIVAGEHYNIDGRAMDDPVISKDYFVNGQSVISLDDSCPMFHDFVNIFNRSIKRMGYQEIDFTESDYSDIVDDVNERLAEKRGEAQKNPDAVEIEPLFILILDKAMNILADRKVK